jgi:hypothetical protein
MLNCSCSRDCIIIVNIADNHKSNMNDKSPIVAAVETASLSLICVARVRHPVRVRDTGFLKKQRYGYVRIFFFLIQNNIA